MDQSRLHTIESRCTQESAPQCRAACPFQMDVRAFMDFMAAGNAAEARKLLDRYLPLPEIFARICDHPCEDVCLRRDLGGSLAIGALERFCLAQPSKTRLLPRQPKKTRIAVLGDGLAGLVAAFELSRKGYPVAVWHEGAPGDVLRRAYPTLDAALVQRELDSLTKNFVTFAPITAAQGLLQQLSADYDSVFVDAGAVEASPALTPEIDGWRDRVDPETRLLSGNICCGGGADASPTGAPCFSPSQQAGESHRAVATLQRLSTDASLTAARADTSQCRLHTPLDGIAPQDRILPARDDYMADEAAREADRCIRCQCLRCVRECAYLKAHNGFPRTYARLIYNNAAVIRGNHMANSLIDGCALCGQCTEICPERFSMSELCLDARHDMVQRKYMPPSAHEFALEDMDSASGPQCALSMADPDHDGPCAQAFFPGCQLAASRGDQVFTLYNWLRRTFAHRGGMGLMLSCCGVPAYWAARDAVFQARLDALRADWESLGRPRLVLACASCLKTFRQSLPEIEVTSLWETLDCLELPPATADLPSPCTIQDPCAARHDAGWQQAVRSLARKQGVELLEPRRTGLETACCGYGGLVWNARPEIAAAMAAQRAEQLDHPALASCIMCRDRLAASGRSGLHLLDILPMTAGVAAPAPEDRGPGLSARRAHRAALRERVERELLGRATPEVPESRVFLGDALLEHIEARHILRSDVEAAVLGVESTGDRFLEKRSGHYVGSWRPRNVTFWVRYSVEDYGYAVHDAWCHRMTTDRDAHWTEDSQRCCRP